MNEMEESEINAFASLWRSKLTFSQYKHGKTPLALAELLPQTEAETQLACALLDRNSSISFNTSFTSTFRKSVARFGSVALVRRLLDISSLNLNVVFENGMGLLHLACIWRNAALANYLINLNCPIVRDNKGRTAYDVCCVDNVKKSLAKYFQKRNRKISTEPIDLAGTIVMQNVPMKTTLLKMINSFNVDFDEILILLQSLTEFDVNSPLNAEGDSLMHVAVRNGLSSLDLVVGLYKILKANIELTNKAGHTALMLAAQLGYPELADILLCVCGANPNTANPVDGNTAMHYAAAADHVEVVIVLEKRGADINLENKSGQLADDYKSSNWLAGLTDGARMIRTLRQERMTTLIELVQHSAHPQVLYSRIRPTDIRFVDEDSGFTLLMAAARFNKPSILRELLRLPGSSLLINAQNYRTGETALSLAVQSGAIDCIRILHACGASSMIPDMEGIKPLDHAIRSKQSDVLLCLLQLYETTLTGLHNARQDALKSLSMQQIAEVMPVLDSVIDKRRKELLIPALFECATTNDAQRLFLLLEEGDEVDLNADYGDWPLFVAVQNGAFDVVKLLLEHGADVRKRNGNYNGFNVLHLACERGLVDMVQYLVERYCVTKHANNHTGGSSSTNDKRRRKSNGLNKRALEVDERTVVLNIDEFTTNGKTPLMLAAEVGCSSIVSYLLQHGASIAILNSKGMLFDSPYAGIQNMLDDARKFEFRRIQAAIMDSSTKSGLKRLKEVWVSPWSHNLRGMLDDTPLMLACLKQRVEIVEFMLQSSLYSPTAIPTVPPSSDSDSVINKNCTSSPVSRAHSSIRDNFTAISYLPSWPMEPRSPISTSLLGERDDEASSDEKVMHLFLERRCSILNDENEISHICAVNHRDGRTALHRCIEGGDDERIIMRLLSKDMSCLNVADKTGRTALHLACELLRSKIVRKLLDLPGIDLNARTLEGQLPEEMCDRSRAGKQIVTLIQSARTGQGPFAHFNRRRRSSIDSMSSISGSTASVTPSGFRTEKKNSMDWNKLEKKYQQMKSALVTVM